MGIPEYSKYIIIISAVMGIVIPTCANTVNYILGKKKKKIIENNNQGRGPGGTEFGK